MRPGDQIDFVIRDGGEVVVEAATIPLSQLRSCLKTARRCAVNLEMQNAIERGATGR